MPPYIVIFIRRFPKSNQGSVRRYVDFENRVLMFGLVDPMR